MSIYSCDIYLCLVLFCLWFCKFFLGSLAKCYRDARPDLVSTLGGHHYGSTVEDGISYDMVLVHGQVNEAGHDRFANAFCVYIRFSYYVEGSGTVLVCSFGPSVDGYVTIYERFDFLQGRASYLYEDDDDRHVAKRFFSIFMTSDLWNSQGVDRVGRGAL